MSFFQNNKLLTKFLCAFLLVNCFWILSSCKPTKTTSPASIETREITDDLDRKINLPLKIERAVSLAPNLTENIFAIGAGNKLVGVTTYCNYPQEAQKIAKVGDTQTPNLETIIALKPQVVLVSTASQMQAFTEQMERQGIAVFVSNPQDLEGVYKSLNQFGELFGENDKAAELVNSLKLRASAVEAKTANGKPIKTFVQISKDPLFTVGKSSFITDLIKRAGGVSVTADIAEAYPKLSKETAIALDPETIILSESEDNLAPNDVFKNSTAVKNGKIFKINADLLSRATPRLVDALEQIADFYRQDAEAQSGMKNKW